MVKYILLMPLMYAVFVGGVEDTIDRIITSAVQDAYKVPLRKTITRDEVTDGSIDGNVFAFIQKQRNSEDSVAQDGHKYLCLLGELMKKSGINMTELQRSYSINKQFNRMLCTRTTANCDKYKNSKYRTQSGICNNLRNPRWGKASEPHARYLHAVYDDGFNSSRQRATNGGCLRSPRDTSNKVFSGGPVTPVEKLWNLLLFAFGQFIDHDLTFTPTAIGQDGNPLNCCGKDRSDSECLPINIPPGDPRFQTTNCMPFTRSIPAPYDDGCFIGYREQFNRVSSFIDGGMIYSDTRIFSEFLRGEQGCLRTSKGDLLPSGGMCHLNVSEDFCQLGGDERVNEVPSLGGLHVVFLRLHNRIAQGIKANTKLSNLDVFLETKKIVGGILQQITYGEYLPIILGKRVRKYYDLDLKPSGFWNKYSSNVNPAIKNVIATAVLRFGHSQIPEKFGIYATKKFPVSAVFKTEDVLMDPHIVVTKNGSYIPGLAQFLLKTPAKKVDRHIENAVRNELFRDLNGSSLDLVSLNIQRGRDHGLAGYNAWRKWCRLQVAQNFSNLMDHDVDVRNRLQNAYNHVDDIDIWVGGVTETPRDDAVVGPLFECLLGRQFRDLKKGDRYWYETYGVEGFTSGQLQEIRKVSLAKILCDTLGLKEIQKQVFSLPDDKKNPLVSCSSLTFMNFSKWKTRRSYSWSW